MSVGRRWSRVWFRDGTIPNPESQFLLVIFCDRNVLNSLLLVSGLMQGKAHQVKAVLVQFNAINKIFLVLKDSTGNPLGRAPGGYSIAESPRGHPGVTSGVR